MTIRARIGHVQPRGKADADPSPRGLLRPDDLFAAALQADVDDAADALRIARGRRVKGEVGIRTREWIMAVARLAAAMPAGAA